MEASPLFDTSQVTPPSFPIEFFLRFRMAMGWRSSWTAASSRRSFLEPESSHSLLRRLRRASSRMATSVAKASLPGTRAAATRPVFAVEHRRGVFRARLSALLQQCGAVARETSMPTTCTERAATSGAMGAPTPASGVGREPQSSAAQRPSGSWGERRMFIRLRNHMGPSGSMQWTDGRCYEGQFRDGRGPRPGGPPF